VTLGDAGWSGKKMKLGGNVAKHPRRASKKLEGLGGSVRGRELNCGWFYEVAQGKES